MSTEAAWLVLVFYLGIGVIALCILDLSTKRIRTRLLPAACETQSLMMTSRTPTLVGRKTALLLTAAALLLFWPVAIAGAMSHKSNKED